MSEYTLSTDELRKLQLVMLDMLIEFDRVCGLHHIPYSIAGGTLLGAVRHKGFIPWDDDIDVVLLREDYERFAQIFNKETDMEKYYFQDADNMEFYRWGYGKIRRKNSAWVRAGQEHLQYEQEIFIDIFPLDAVPSGKIAAKLHNVNCFVIRKSLWSEVGKITDDNGFRRAIYMLLSKTPLSFWLNRLRKMANNQNEKAHEFLRVITIPTPRPYDYEGKVKWYESYTELEVEGRNFKAMSSYKDYLKLKYGDYMKLPPENKRETHPVSELKLPCD